MQIPKEAIACAIEGGWHFKRHANQWILEQAEEKEKGSLYATYDDAALDPEFWQAVTREKEVILQNGPHGNIPHYYAMRFYDLILTGGDTEVFWKELLPASHKQK